MVKSIYRKKTAAASDVEVVVALVVDSVVGVTAWLVGGEG
jgi:hypothetical protein